MAMQVLDKFGVSHILSILKRALTGKADKTLSNVASNDFSSKAQASGVVTSQELEPLSSSLSSLEEQVEKLLASGSSNKAVFFNTNEWVLGDGGWYSLTLDIDVAGIHGVYRADTYGATYSQIMCDISIVSNKATLRSLDACAGYVIISLPSTTIMELVVDENGANIVTTYATRADMVANTTTLNSSMDTLRNDMQSSLTILSNEVAESLQTTEKNVATALSEYGDTLQTYVADVTENGGKVSIVKGNGDVSTFNAGLNILSRNTTYSVGDVVYSPLLPSWAYLECVSEGTTGANEPAIEV